MGVAVDGDGTDVHAGGDGVVDGVSVGAHAASVCECSADKPSSSGGVGCEYVYVRVWASA